MIEETLYSKSLDIVTVVIIPDFDSEYPRDSILWDNRVFIYNWPTDKYIEASVINLNNVG